MDAPGAAGGTKTRNEDVPFWHMSNTFERCAQISASSVKGKDKKLMRELARFMTQYINRDSSDDTFQIMRLLCPLRDRARGTYQLKEATLTSALARACGVLKGGPEETQLVEFRKYAKHGQYHQACYDILLKKHCTIPEGATDRALAALTVGQLNVTLDQLADPTRGKLEQKAEALRHLITHTTAIMMKWIVCIVLQDLKIGRSAATITKLYHPDAEELWSLTQDLKQVCDTLRDVNVPMKRRDVEPGCAVDPMKASAELSVSTALERMGGKPYVAEIKLDGERLVLHRLTKVDPVTQQTVEEIKYTSRKGFEHGQKSDYSVLDSAVRAQVAPLHVMLDGEIIVWNKTKKRFEPFGTVKSLAQAAMEGKSGSDTLNMQTLGKVLAANPDYQQPMLSELELLYVVFDILYSGEESHIQRPLSERHKLLRQAVRDAPPEGFLLGPPGGSVRGRLVPLLPEVPFLGMPLPFSRVGQDAVVLQEMVDRALKAGEEGVVVKRLDSPWQYGKRSSSWVKLKPDYLEKQDIDAVIMGATFGTGRHTGQIHEFILGLPVPPPGGGPPTVYETFCRVGTGLDDLELARLREALRPAGWREFKSPADAPKNFRITGQEEAELWVVDINKSIVLQVQADVRIIVSKVFAAPYSLRFPRVTRIRTDKHPSQCNTSADLEAMVHKFRELREKEARGGAAGGGGLGDVAISGGYGHGRWRRRGDRGAMAAGAAGAEAVKARNIVPSHLLPTDTSGVLVESDVLKGKKICFLGNSYGEHTQQEMEALVKRLGGQVQMTLPKRRDSAIVVLAHQLTKSMRTVQEQGWYDILRISWLLDSQLEGKAVAPRPWHYLHMTHQTRNDVTHHDEHGDPWLLDLDPEGRDLRSILESHLDLKIYQQVVEALRQNVGEVKRQRDAVLSGGMDLDTRKATPQSLLMGIESELAELGVAAPPTSLFRGKVLYFLDLTAATDTGPGVAPTAPGSAAQRSQGAEAPAGLHSAQDGAEEAGEEDDPRVQGSELQGVSKAKELAGYWKHEQLKYWIQGLKLQVVSLGGQVQEELAPGVTHIVVCTPGANEDPSHARSKVCVGASKVLSALQQTALNTALAHVNLPPPSQPPAPNDPGPAAAATKKRAAPKKKTARSKKAAAAEDTSVADDGGGVRRTVVQLAVGGAGAVGSGQQRAGGAEADEDGDVVGSRARRLLAHVRRRLVDGRVHMVDPSWVTASCPVAVSEGDKRQDPDVADGVERLRGGRTECEPEAHHPPWVLPPPPKPSQPSGTGATTSAQAQRQEEVNSQPTHQPPVQPSLYTMMDLEDLEDNTANRTHADPLRNLVIVREEDGPPPAPSQQSHQQAGNNMGQGALGGGGVGAVNRGAPGGVPGYAEWPWQEVGLQVNMAMDTTGSSSSSSAGVSDARVSGSSRSSESDEHAGPAARGRGRGRGHGRTGAGSGAAERGRGRKRAVCTRVGVPTDAGEDDGAAGAGSGGEGAVAAGGEEQAAAPAKRGARRSRPPGYPGAKAGAAARSKRRKLSVGGTESAHGEGTDPGHSDPEQPAGADAGAGGEEHAHPAEGGTVRATRSLRGQGRRQAVKAAESDQEQEATAQQVGPDAGASAGGTRRATRAATGRGKGAQEASKVDAGADTDEQTAAQAAGGREVVSLLDDEDDQQPGVVGAVATQPAVGPGSDDDDLFPPSMGAAASQRVPSAGTAAVPRMGTQTLPPTLVGASVRSVGGSQGGGSQGGAGPGTQTQTRRIGLSALLDSDDEEQENQEEEVPTAPVAAAGAAQLPVAGAAGTQPGASGGSQWARPGVHLAATAAGVWPGQELHAGRAQSAEGGTVEVAGDTGADAGAGTGATGSHSGGSVAAKTKGKVSLRELMAKKGWQ